MDPAALARARTQREGDTLVDGARVHWAEIGSGRPLVLLHGMGDSHRTWKHVAPALAEGRRVIMPDLAGHGRSSRPDASYALEWHSRIMSRWAVLHGLEDIDVVGHSFGGGVAQVMLLEPLPRIRRLVLVAAGGLGREVRKTLRLASLPHIVERIGQPFMKLGTKATLGRKRHGFSAADIAELAAMNRTPGTARAFARTVRGVIDWRGQHRSFFQRVHEIDALPAISVLWGSEDTIIPPSHGEQFACALQGVSLQRFEGCGHYLHREAPARFVREVRAFLDAPVQPTACYPRA